MRILKICLFVVLSFYSIECLAAESMLPITQTYECEFYVDTERVSWDTSLFGAPIFMYQDRVYVPVRKFLELLHYDVSWNEEQHLVSIWTTTSSHIHPDSNSNGLINYAERLRESPYRIDCSFQFDGQLHSLGYYEMFIYRDKLYAPIRFLAEMLKDDIVWSAGNENIALRKSDRIYINSQINFPESVNEANLLRGNNQSAGDYRFTVVDDMLYVALDEAIYRISLIDPKQKTKLCDLVTGDVETDTYVRDSLHYWNGNIYYTSGAHGRADVYCLEAGKKSPKRLFSLMNGEIFICGDWLYYSNKTELRSYISYNSAEEFRKKRENDEICRLNLISGESEILYTGPVNHLGGILENRDLYFEGDSIIYKLNLQSGECTKILKENENTTPTTAHIEYLLLGDTILYTGGQVGGDNTYRSIPLTLYDIKSNRKKGFTYVDENQQISLVNSPFIYDSGNVYFAARKEYASKTPLYIYTIDLKTSEVTAIYESKNNDTFIDFFVHKNELIIIRDDEQIVEKVSLVVDDD